MPSINSSPIGACAAIVASAPGRICLFGEHQDYLGLPVIPAAINLRVTVEARANDDGLFRLNLPDIGESRELDPREHLEYRHGRDYLAAAINVMKRDGIIWNSGYDVEVHGEIPLNSGASSSSALQVAWCAMLLAAAGSPKANDPMEVASYAHRSEVVEFRSPGGTMDHYSTAVGGIIYLDCGMSEVTALPSWPSEFVLIDSGIPKDTNGTLASRRALVEELDISFESLPEKYEDVPRSLFDGMTPEQLPILEATLRNRELTQQAARLLRKTEDHEGLGRLLLEHHHQLSANLGISHPEIDRHIEDGMERGALGGKINGSGCGGSFFMYCPGRCDEFVAFYRGKGLRAWRVEIGEGVQVDASRMNNP